MCYVKLTAAEMEKQGRLRTIEEWTKVGRQMKEAGVLFLLLTGGEPLTYPGFKELYLNLKEMGMILTINTNGTLIDESWAEFFEAHKPRRINITLYGTNNDTYRTLCHYPGGYDRTIQAIQLLRNKGIDVKIGTSATKANRADIPDIVALQRKMDIPVRVDSYMMPAIRERMRPYDQQARLNPVDAARIQLNSLREEMGEELFKQYRMQSLVEIEHFVPQPAPLRMSCYAGHCSFTINWQGEMRPCVVMSEPSASVFDLGFQAAWTRVSGHCANIVLSEKCRTCKLRSLCRTCAAAALLETGSYIGTPEYMCIFAEETYRLLQTETE